MRVEIITIATVNIKKKITKHPFMIVANLCLNFASHDLVSIESTLLPENVMMIL